MINLAGVEPIRTYLIDFYDECLVNVWEANRNQWLAHCTAMESRIQVPLINHLHDRLNG
ncbi:MAG: hypothetical protein P8X74_06240 [Reinekea sp.]